MSSIADGVGGGGGSSSSKEASRANSMKVEAQPRPRVEGKAGDISAESFQKSAFYS